jgi:hypothetical protein
MSLVVCLVLLISMCCFNKTINEVDPGSIDHESWAPPGVNMQLDRCLVNGVRLPLCGESDMAICVDQGNHSP